MHQLESTIRQLARQDPWVDRAACRAHPFPDWWFASPNPAAPDHDGFRRARGVCGRCPVREECLQWAVENNETEGLWGGMTWGQRKKLRRQWVRRRGAA